MFDGRIEGSTLRAHGAQTFELRVDGDALRTRARRHRGRAGLAGGGAVPAGDLDELLMKPWPGRLAKARGPAQ